ncbi:uncharacterized protein LOC135370612 [Ornithodoros turicata]|uniref:uncharacterized protein LOC135370612 n=1 Tax=Ornithodoros turicata TaxID=34597 RepID=UPI003138D50F
MTSSHLPEARRNEEEEEEDASRQNRFVPVASLEPPYHTVTMSATSKSCIEDVRASRLVRMGQYALVTLLSALMIMATLFSALMRQPAEREPLQQARRLGYPSCVVDEPDDKPIICMYEQSRISHYFRVSKIPAHICRHVVFCCVQTHNRKFTVEDTQQAMDFGSLLGRHMPSARGYLGIGGRDVDYDALNLELQSGRAVTVFIERCITLSLNAKLGGGIAYFIPDFSRFRPRVSFEALVMDTAVALATKEDQRVIVVLPESAGDVVRYFHPGIFRFPNIYTVVLSHEMDPRYRSPPVAACATPYSAPTLGRSLEAAYRDMKAHYRNYWQTVEPGLLFSFSLAWYQFLLPYPNASDGAPARYVRALPYRDICHNFGHRAYETHVDPVTDCVVVRDGQQLYSGFGLSSGEKFLRKYRRIRGIAVFDIDMDDFDGKCEHYNHPLLQGLADELAEDP